MLACLDARRGEAFVAAWRGGERLLAPAARAAGAARRAGRTRRAARRRRPGPLAAGDGAIRFREQLEPAGFEVPADGSPLHRVRADALCRLALAATPVAREALVPEYVRAPDAVPKRSGPAPGDRPVTAPPDIRRLTYADLPQVIAIERRAFPTPWSLAMFVLELSKPSGICLAALRGGARAASSATASARATTRSGTS